MSFDETWQFDPSIHMEEEKTKNSQDTHEEQGGWDLPYQTLGFTVKL